MFENCILVERRNGHKIYEIEKDMQYGIDFCDGGGTTAYSLKEAERKSDEYYELEKEIDNLSLEDLVTDQDLY